MSQMLKPGWRRPTPLGYGAAIDSMSNVAAPLLAGFSITTLGVVLTAHDAFRWPGTVFIALTAAAACFVMCLQLGFLARMHLYSPADAAAWWPAKDLEEREADIRDEQEHDFGVWSQWMNLSRHFYTAGVIVLWVGLTAALAPKTGESATEGASRWVAAANAAATAFVEVLWMLVPPSRRWLARRRALRLALQRVEPSSQAPPSLGETTEV
jgi:hypothetical protein